MEIWHYTQLAMFGLIPVVASIILYFLDNKYFNSAPYYCKQATFGIIFGIIAILGTEFGVNIDGATMNARDAAPICAGLIFGAPAGIIAGVIGGVERWFAVYWGAGQFTRIACSISTVIAGVFAAYLRKKLFNDDVPRSVYAFTAGIIAEVFHLSMVFITNVNNTAKAFEVVRKCTLPMVSVNALSCLFAVLVINYFIRKTHADEGKKSITRIFQKRLLIVVIFSFLITNTFSYLLQDRLAKTELANLLEQNIEDVIKDINVSSDAYLVKNTMKIAECINEHSGVLTQEYLFELLGKFSVNEIHIINRNGIITCSTIDEYYGFDMYSGEQSKAFMCLLEGEQSYVQELSPTTYDSSVYKKFAAVTLASGNIVQVGLTKEQYFNSIDEDVELVAQNRHIGETGHIIVLDSDTNRIVSDYDGNNNRLLSSIKSDVVLDEVEEYEENIGTFYDTKSYYMYAEYEGYSIISLQTCHEADLTRDMNLYLTTFMEIMVFAFIFIVIFLAINRVIVNNVLKVNGALFRITDGDLSVTVDAKDNEEFESLSNGINTMVDRLKELIRQAEEKMKAELDYAAEIQQSALPSTFPAFPDHEEFDIYASMDPAKEVGGDFYDFYFIDANKLAIIVADVSGKGIPASLFMMRAKTIIQSYAQYGIAVNDVFTNANFNLCEGNEAGLFVTAWMAIIDLETGHMTYANAGHNPPLIKHPNGKYEYLRSKAGFILGGMEGVVYKLFEMDLEPGTELFVYTDGLTEAQNIKQELYGEARLEEAINSYTFDNSRNICDYLTKKVDEFVGEADQFDDLTMLHFYFKRKTFDK